eukprot:3396417-Alexandrium_andersonii.AAC.1
MSASLVGSEMCIRDRSRKAHTPIFKGLDSSLPGGLARQGARLHTRAPVSYTHLTLPTICSV